MVDGVGSAPDGDKEARELWARAAISDRETKILGAWLLFQVPLYVWFLALILKSYSSLGGVTALSLGPVFLVLVAGAMGGLLHSLMSFSLHIARRDFSRSWLWWYISRPMHGAISGFAVYFVLRMAGQLKDQVDAAVMVIGVGVLAGLFSEQAVEKLSQIANTVLAPGRQKEIPNPQKIPLIKGVKGSADNEFAPTTTSLVVTGENFIEKAIVLANDLPQATKWVSTSQLDVTLDGAKLKVAEAQELTLVVENPDKQKSAPFKIKRKA